MNQDETKVEESLPGQKNIEKEISLEKNQEPKDDNQIPSSKISFLVQEMVQEMEVARAQLDFINDNIQDVTNIVTRIYLKDKRDECILKISSLLTLYQNHLNTLRNNT